MDCIKTYIKAVCSIVAVVLLQGCSDDGIIKKQTMSSIIMEMFLADQYIEDNPDMRAQTDSMTVYPAIVAKYGYTMEEYSNSIRYWLQEGEEYGNILKDAQKAMEERADFLNEQIREIELLRRGPERWWALDSVRRVDANEFLYDHLLRGVRWLVVPGEKLPGWKMLDSAVVDIPQNPVWWSNNMIVPERGYETFFVMGTEEDKKTECETDGKKGEKEKDKDNGKEVEADTAGKRKPELKPLNLR